MLIRSYVSKNQQELHVFPETCNILQFGFISKQLFRRKLLNFSTFSTLVEEKWKIFCCLFSEMRGFFLCVTVCSCKYTIILSKIGKIYTFPWLIVINLKQFLFCVIYWRWLLNISWKNPCFFKTGFTAALYQNLKVFNADFQNMNHFTRCCRNTDLFHF